MIVVYSINDLFMEQMSVYSCVSDTYCFSINQHNIKRKTTFYLLHVLSYDKSSDEYIKQFIDHVI